MSKSNLCGLIQLQSSVACLIFIIPSFFLWLTPRVDPPSYWSHLIKFSCSRLHKFHFLAFCCSHCTYTFLVCFCLLIDTICVRDDFSESWLNTDIQIIRIGWHVPLVSVSTEFYCIRVWEINERIIQALTSDGTLTPERTSASVKTRSHAGTIGWILVQEFEQNL